LLRMWIKRWGIIGSRACTKRTGTYPTERLGMATTAAALAHRHVSPLLAT